MTIQIIDNIVVNRNWHPDTKREYVKAMHDNYPNGEKTFKYKLNKKTLVFERIPIQIEYHI